MSGEKAEMAPSKRSNECEMGYSMSLWRHPQAV